jgi:hypothetical protein
VGWFSWQHAGEASRWAALSKVEIKNIVGFRELILVATCH